MVSIVELGIVRDVCAQGDELVVSITPTYSGCPATSRIMLDVEQALREGGFSNAKVQRVIAPPWTTDWITEAGRQKLKRYGIAPPQGSVQCIGALMRAKTPARVTCPRCGSDDTQEVSRFGSTPCKASYQCRTCLEPFDYFKPF